MSKVLSKALFLALILFLSLGLKNAYADWEDIKKQAKEAAEKKIKEAADYAEYCKKQAKETIERIKLQRAWMYTGPGYTAGHELKSAEGEKWYEKNKEILKNAGGLKTFEEDNKKHPDVFVPYVKGTPDEYAYEHDLAYCRAEEEAKERAKEGWPAKKIEEEKLYKEFVADIEFVKNIRLFVSKNGSRRSEYEGMDNKYKVSTLCIYELFIYKILFECDERKKGFNGQDVVKRYKDLEKEGGISLTGMQKEYLDEYNNAPELRELMMDTLFPERLSRPKDCQTSPSADPSKTKGPPKSIGSMGQKEKEELYSCICSCTIAPTIGVGSKWDPKSWKNASPSCDDARHGPCVGFGLGCWRKHMTSGGECFEQCVKEANANKQDVIGEINRTKSKAYNDFIGEARNIMEGYAPNRSGIYRIFPETLKRTREYLKMAAVVMPIRNSGTEIVLTDFVMSKNFSIDETTAELYAAGNKPLTYIEMVKEKNRRGDPDRALALVRAAEVVMPERKASGETTNILAEFAIIMSKASLNIVTELEFDDGLYLLHKASEFYKSGESNPLGQTIKGLISSFEKWKNDWQTIRAEVPNCLSMIKDKRVCECDRLNREKIMPASNSFVVYAHASPQKWEISTAYGQPRPIPKKDKLMADLKQNLETALRKCAAHPALKTKDMTQLRDYDTCKTIEKSSYINQEDHRKYSALPISDEQAIKKAEKLLGEPGLCDCERDKIKAILETAKEGFKYSKLEVDLTASKKSLRLGEYLRVSLMIKSGRKPYTYVMTGDLTANVRGTEVGAVTEYPPKTPGTKTVTAMVTDAAGDTRTASVTFEVLSPVGYSSTKTQPSLEKPGSDGIKYVKGFEGKWNTNWGLLEFRVDGLKVYGNYTHDSGKIDATLSSDKKTMEGEWREAPDYMPPKNGGKVTFTLSPDGNTIRGKWGYGENLNGGDWTGTRIKDATPPPPTDRIGGSGSFKITKVEYPSRVVSNGTKGDLTVYWSGDPVFPVKIAYRPKSCSSGVVCSTPSIRIDNRRNPLVFPKAVWCASAKDIHFDYEVVMIDARGTESAPYPAPFDCKGSQ